MHIPTPRYIKKTNVRSQYAVSNTGTSIPFPTCGRPTSNSLAELVSMLGMSGLSAASLAESLDAVWSLARNVPLLQNRPAFNSAFKSHRSQRHNQMIICFQCVCLRIEISSFFLPDLRCMFFNFLLTLEHRSYLCRNW